MLTLLKPRAFKSEVFKSFLNHLFQVPRIFSAECQAGKTVLPYWVLLTSKDEPACVPLFFLSLRKGIEHPIFLSPINM